MKLVRVPMAMLIAGCLVLSCRSPESTHPDHPVVGSLDPTPSQRVEIAVLWVSPNDDQPRPRPVLRRIATTQDGAFAGSVPEPPAEVRWQGISIGLLLQLPAGFSIPDGPVEQAREAELDRVLEERTSSGVEVSAVPTSDPLIFREHAGTAADAPAWLEKFPAGISCGVCQRASGSAEFDSLAPVTCDQVRLEKRRGCNWT